MSEEKEVLNPNETRQDYDAVIRANLGEVHNMLKKANAGEDIKKMGQHSDDLFPTSDAMSFGKDNSHNPLATGRTLSRSERYMQQLESPNNSMGLPLSYGEKVAKAKLRRRVLSGKVKNANPLMQIKPVTDIQGNKIRTKQRSRLSVAQLQAYPAGYGPGVKKLFDNIDMAKGTKEKPTTSNLLIGINLGHADAKARAPEMNKAEAIDKTSSMAAPARKEVLKHILPEQTADRIARNKPVTEAVKPKRTLLTKEDLKKKPEPAAEKQTPGGILLKKDPAGGRILLTKAPVPERRAEKPGLSLEKKPQASAAATL